MNIEGDQIVLNSYIVGDSENFYLNENIAKYDISVAKDEMKSFNLKMLSSMNISNV